MAYCMSATAHKMYRCIDFVDISRRSSARRATITLHSVAWVCQRKLGFLIFEGVQRSSRRARPPTVQRRCAQSEFNTYQHEQQQDWLNVESSSRQTRRAGSEGVHSIWLVHRVTPARVLCGTPPRVETDPYHVPSAQVLVYQPWLYHCFTIPHATHALRLMRAHTQLLRLTVECFIIIFLVS